MKLSLQTHVVAAFLNLWSQSAVSSISVPEIDMCKNGKVTSQKRNIAIAARGDHDNKNCTCCILGRYHMFVIKYKEKDCREVDLSGTGIGEFCVLPGNIKSMNELLSAGYSETDCFWLSYFGNKRGSIALIKPAENRSVSVTCGTTTPPPDPKLILLPTILGVLALVVIIVCVIFFCNRKRKTAKLHVAQDINKLSQDGYVYAIPNKFTRKPKTTKAETERRPSESSEEEVNVPVPKKSWETGGDGVKQSKHTPGKAREASTVREENNVYVPFESFRHTPSVTTEPSTIMVENDIYVPFHSYRHTPSVTREPSTIMVENDIYVPFHSSRPTPAFTREPSTVMLENGIYVNFQSSPC